MTSPPSWLLAQRPRFVLLPAAAILLPLLMVIVGGWIAWRTVWNDAADQLTRSADAGAEYAARALGGFVVAAGLMDDVVAGLSDIQIRDREVELHATFHRLLADLPQADAGYVIDRHGNGLVGASVYPVPADLNIASLPYFKIMSAASAPPVYLSEVYLSGIGAVPQFVVSRRRSTGTSDPVSNDFSGVVSVAVSPAQIGAGIGRLAHVDDTMLSLIRWDGQILASSAGPDGPVPPIAANSPFFAMVGATNAGTYHDLSPQGGQKQLVAMRRIEGFPAFITAARLHSTIVGEWRNRMAVHLIFGIPATLALLALSLRVRASQMNMATANVGLEHALSESDARLRRVQTAGGALSFEIGPDGTVECDNLFRVLWGFSSHARVDFAALAATVHADDRAAFQAEHDRLASQGGSFYSELCVVLPDIGERWLLLLGEAVREPGGAPARFIGVAMDITDRKQIEAAVQDNEVRLRDLMVTLDLATVMVRDLDGVIHFWSDGCTRMFGWTADDAIGQKTRELLGTISTVPAEEIEAQLLEAGEWEGDFRQFRRDGTEITVATRKVLRRDETGRSPVIMVTLADVTQLRRTRQELEELNDRLESLVREEVTKREAAQQRAARAERIHALGELAGGIAHDLNNVLQAVTSGASLASKDAANPERVRRLARMITEAAHRGAGVTRRLLSFSRQATLRAEPIAPRALLLELREVLAHILGGHVRCEVDAPDDLPFLLADRGQLETALVNLATNARDAMPDGGPLVLSAASETVADQITHPGAVAPGRYIRITVTDTGCGMDAVALARAFEPFYTTKQEGDGTGLGLPMVHGFAVQSGGALAIASIPGLGTEISLWLPEAMSQAPRVANSGATTAGQDPTRPVRVLLVDDDMMVRDAVQSQLEASGYFVSAAPDGPRALTLLDTLTELDVLVCDLSMPGMGGLAVIREAQKRRQGLPAILLTGYAGDATALPTNGARFALLRKPVAMSELADVIAIVLAGDQPGEQHTETGV